MSQLHNINAYFAKLKINAMKFYDLVKYNAMKFFDQVKYRLFAILNTKNTSIRDKLSGTVTFYISSLVHKNGILSKHDTSTSFVLFQMLYVNVYKRAIQ